MITYEQYCEQFEKKLNIPRGYIFRGGLAGTLLEEFTKGYARLAIEEQSKEDVSNFGYYNITDTPKIELI